MKKINISYFLVLFCLTLMYSCSSDLSEDLDTNDKNELSIDQIEIDKSHSLNDFSTNTSSAKKGGGGIGGSIKANEAHLNVDTDDDGVFETKWIKATTGYTCCVDAINDMIDLANLYGWPYQYGAQCRIIYVHEVELCDQSSEF